MSDDIKVGDVCIVAGGCCRLFCGTYVGRDCVTTEAFFRSDFVCMGCGERTGQAFVVEGDAANQMTGICVIPARYLRRKPPKSDDDAEPRTDFTPANRDDWPSTHWHPDNTKVPA